MYEEFRGKVALVTGSTTGIGKAAALRFGRLGCRVVVSGAHNEVLGEVVAAEIRAFGGEAVFCRCDVTRESEVEDLIRTTVRQYGGLDYAFNNAGLGPDGVRIPFVPLTEVTEKDWDLTIDTNTKGVFFSLKHELRQMQEQGRGGAIVNTASLGGLRMTRNFGAYGPSKAAVIALTKLAASENAENGIRVNVVCPGMIGGTVLTGNNFRSNPGKEETIRANNPMRRIGTVEDVADSVIWLCSDAASYVTGESIRQDGGAGLR